MKRYRIYKGLKWFFVVMALMAIFMLYVGILNKSNLDGDTAMAAANLICVIAVGHAVLAIFFKLQEDSNKPTAEE